MTEPKIPKPPVWIELATFLVPHLPAGRYRALNWLCRRSTPPFLAHLPGDFGGYSFICDLRDTISREVCFTRVYEPQETWLVREILQPGMSFVDVGANWGYFTLLAAHLVGVQGRILSLEPDPRMFARLQENIECNRLSQVTALPIAAAATAEKLTLAGYDEVGGNFGISRLVSGVLPPTISFQVEAVALDDLLDAQQLEAVDLMKMDIEGAEAFALVGLERSLRLGRIKRLLLELHPVQLEEMGASAQAVMQVLSQAGYKPMKIDHSQSTTRAMAYGRISSSRQILHPLDLSATLDAWPHQLWVAPEVKAL